MRWGDMGRMRRAVLGAAAVVAVAAGCTSVIPGSGGPATGPGAAGPEGSPPAPAEIVPAPELSAGTVVEAHRVAAVTALVQPSFPERTATCLPNAPLVVPRGVAVQHFASDTVAPILERYGFVAGWGRCRRDAAGLSTVTLVMEMSDPASAARAGVEIAADLAARAATPDGGTGSAGAGGLQEVVLPDSRAAGLLEHGGEHESVRAFAASGRMLAHVFHEAPPGQGVQGADRVLGEQAELLAGFVPTPQAQVPELEPDPHGLLKVAVKPPGELSVFTGPYDLEGYLRLAIDPLREREVLTANGFTGMYAKYSGDDGLSYAVNLYAFPTSAETNNVYNAFSELEATEFGNRKFRLPSIPDAPCFVFNPPAGGGTTYGQRCYVGYGSYLASIDVSGMTDPDDTTGMDRLLPAQRDLIDG